MIKLYHDDCFNVFPTIEDKSVDLVLCDMPYGITACKWDTVIDLTLMWEHIKRIAKDNAAIALTAAQPFTSVLVCSNLKMFKQQLVWIKNRKTNFLNAKKQHLRQHEDILIFYKKQCAYNPQGVYDVERKLKNSVSTGGKTTGFISSNSDRAPGREYIQKQAGYPSDLVNITDSNNNSVHPTQKPVALMEYLIKTYSNDGDVVLDFCVGSGTTGVACKNLNRSFIGIEKELEYYNIAKERIGL
jgi:site-specific DNA-methyltransferase (adenine-specific)